MSTLKHSLRPLVVGREGLLVIMGNKTLRRKISLFILIPLILGTVITAVVSWLPIYLQYSYWISDVITDMINDQGEVLMEVSLHISALTAGAVQIPSNYIMMVTSLIEQYYESDFNTKPGFNSTGNYVNAMDLIDWKANQTMMNESMWYTSPADFSVDDLKKETWSNLNDSAVFDMFLRPVLTNYTQNRIKEYFHVFNDTGFFYMYPATTLNFLENYTNNSCPYHSDQYDPRCAPFYSSVVDCPDRFLAVIPDPFLDLRNHSLAQTSCRGVWSAGSLTLTACVVFDISDVIEIANNLTVGNNSYAFALYLDESVLFHPRMNESAVNSILQMEFNRTSEAEAFNSSIIPLFKTGQKALEHYTKNGKKMLIAITPVYIMLSINQIYVHQFSVGVVMPEDPLWERFDPLRYESYIILMVEVAIFFGVMTVIVFAGWL